MIRSASANGIQFSRLDVEESTSLDISNVILTNKTSETVTALHIVGCGNANTWGPTWLTGDVASGSQYNQLMQAGCKSLRAVTAGGSMYELDEVEVRETYRWVLE